MKKIITIAIALSMLTSTAFAEDGSNKEKDDEKSCPVVPPQTIYVDKIVYVDKPVPGPTVYVDKIVPGPTVYVDRNVAGPTVYVDKVVPETITVTNTVYVDKPIDRIVSIENPLNTDIQNKLNKLTSKYNKLLKSYKIMHNHELKEAAKKKVK